MFFITTVKFITYAVAKKSLKTFRLAGIRTQTSAKLVQRSNQLS